MGICLLWLSQALLDQAAPMNDCRILLLFFVSIGVLATGGQADWPGFLGGRERAAMSRATPPVSWSPESNITWKVPLVGHGQSSPVVMGNQVYVTAIEGPNKETNWVFCFDLETGAKQWQQSIPSSLPVKNDVYTSRAAPTPVCDDDGVYAFFESGNLIALAADGTERWRRDLIADYGKYEGRFGLGGSLAQLDDRIFVLADHDGPAYLLAIDKKTGKTLWKTDRESRIAWSSPMVIPVAGQPQIVVSASGTIDGYSPETGKRLWQFDDVGGNTVASPTLVGDGKFLVGASPGRNGENTEGAKRSNMLMEIQSIGEDHSGQASGKPRFEPRVVWRSPKATSSFGSPIAYAQHAYFTNRAGALFCIDIDSGELAYTARLSTSNWATPVGVGQHVFIFGKNGSTTVLKTGPKKEVVATNQLWSPGDNPSDNPDGGRFGGEIQYGVAVTSHGFVVRTGANLYLIGQRHEPDAAGEH